MIQCQGVTNGRGAYHPFRVIQWVIEDSHLGQKCLRHSRLAFVVLIIRGKLQLVDGVTEIVSDAILLQVWDQFVDVLVGRRLEGTARREMNIASNLVDTEATRYIATLVRLFFQLFCPAFLGTLDYPIETFCQRRVYAGERTNLGDRVRSMKAPTSVDVRLADFLAGVTATIGVRG